MRPPYYSLVISKRILHAAIAITMAIGAFVWCVCIFDFPLHSRIYDVAYFFAFLPAQAFYLIGHAIGIKHPENGPFWEGGHGPAVLTPFGVIVIYEIIPLLVLLLVAKITKQYNKQIK